jgi:YaiO family outer membrane protein
MKIGRLAHIVGTSFVLACPIAIAGGQAPVHAHRSERPAPLDDLRRVGARYQFDNVSDVDPFQDATLEYAERLPMGTVVLDVNAARRYGTNGTQLELQAYPHLGRHSYVFLDVAASSAKEVFLPLRVSAEPYYNWANGWEMSAGAQYLRTPGSASDLYTYTGTVAKYFGNYWISARPSFTPSQISNSYGWGFTARRYFSDRYDYAALTFSRNIGIDPSATDPTVLARPPRLGTYTVSLDRRQPIGRTRSRAAYGIGYQREEIAPARFRLHRTATFGLEWFIP